MRYVAAVGGDSAPVLVTRLVGNSSWVTTGPPGPGPATGKVLMGVANAKTGQIIDSGLEHHDQPPELPNATLPYAR